MRRFFNRYGWVAAAVVDVGALLFFYYVLLWRVPRPFDVLVVMLLGLALLTAILVKQPFVRNAMLVVASLMCGVFLLEMGQKYFNIMRDPDISVDDGRDRGSYGWKNSAGYLAALKKALADGVLKPEQTNRFAGDIFAGRDTSTLRVTHEARTNVIIDTAGLKPLYSLNRPLGVELNPDNLTRITIHSAQTGELVSDTRNTVNGFGVRETPGTPDAEEVFLFVGCSYTYGYFLNDDETAAYYFSRERDFSSKVINLGIWGLSPNHVLRDLELNHHLTRQKVRPEQVKGVYYQLIDIHSKRVLTPHLYPTPIYKLVDGRPVYQRIMGNRDLTDTLSILLQRSRVYPLLAPRVRDLFNLDSASSDEWEMLLSVLGEINRICRERYGVPLVVVYWDGNNRVVERLKRDGIEVVRIADVFEEGVAWRDFPVKYLIYDGHPSAYANYRIGKYLADKVAKREDRQ